VQQVRRAKIVATLGPATDGLEAELVRAGLDVARLNFSHGTQADHARRCAAIRAASAQVGRQVAVMQDLQGPKIRVGSLENGGPVRLEAGRELVITTHNEVGSAQRISCTYPHLAQDVRPGDRVLLDDGRIRLSVLESEDAEVRTRVEEGGPLGEHKGINLPGVAVSSPAMTDKDRADMAFGLQQLSVDFVALSFIRTADEVRAAEKLMKSLGRTVPLIVKLEKGEAIENLRSILQVADGVMVARGDLGVELAPEQVPMLQKRIIQRANARGIPVITATQMLESMVTAPTPTRAEVTDVANAVLDGTSALMLSAETAIGTDPVGVVATMARIAARAEQDFDYLGWGANLGTQQVAGGRASPAGITAATTAAGWRAAIEEDAAAIIACTRSGATARAISRFRPSMPLVAATPSTRTARQLTLSWGVEAFTVEESTSTDDIVWFAVQAAVRAGYAARGDVVVVLAGSPTEPEPATDTLRLVRIH
jgi:pyruvate kinase